MMRKEVYTDPKTGMLAERYVDRGRGGCNDARGRTGRELGMTGARGIDRPTLAQRKRGAHA